MQAMIPFKLKAKKKNPQNYLFLVTYMSAKIQIYPQEKKKSTRTGSKLVAAVTGGKEFNT